MKKIISSLLIFVMVFSIGTNQIFAAAFSNDKTIVYVDGIKFKITSEEDSTTVETVGLVNNSKMILDLEGNARVELVDENRNIKEYTLKINTLLEDAVDFTITDNNGETKHYNDIEQLKNDEYEGQAAIVIGIGGATLGAFLQALLYAIIGTTVVYIAGYACMELADALRTRKMSSTKYYRAFRSNSKVYVGKQTISRSAAVSRLRTGQDTYTWSKSNAKSIASSVGRGVKGPEIDSLRRKGVYYYHYHPKSGARFHSFYGNAYVVK